MYYTRPENRVNRGALGIPAGNGANWTPPAYAHALLALTGLVARYRSSVERKGRIKAPTWFVFHPQEKFGMHVRADATAEQWNAAVARYLVKVSKYGTASVKEQK